VDFNYHILPFLVPKNLEQVLIDVGSLEGIQASALISDDGAMIECDSGFNGFDTRNICAIIAMLMRSATHSSKEMDKGEVEYLLIEGKHGGIILARPVSKMILAAFTEGNAPIEPTIQEIKNVCDRIEHMN
jgi:predicted regulator of Ras-like GTPase activity (Roadblock/LC7/MglB family)